MWIRCCRCKELVESDRSVSIKVETGTPAAERYAFCPSCAKRIKKLIEEEIVWNQNTGQSR